MKFQSVSKRPNWKTRADELGYLSSILDDPPYWVEALDQPFCAVFSLREIEDIIETATEEITKLALEAVDYVVNGSRSEELFARLRIPPMFREPIRKSWRRNDGSIYGRFDFSYNNGRLKLLELNFDTPTSLYEASVLQWFWLEDLKARNELPADADQFNSLHDQLIAALGRHCSGSRLFHLTTINDAPEDEETVRYLESCAIQAGLQTAFLHLKDLGFDSDGRLVDLEGRHIEKLFKLYPWEFITIEEAYAQQVKGTRVFTRAIETHETALFEPPWKLLLSNKAILPLLWEFSPGHRFLLETCFDDQSPAANRMRKQPHVRKPIFGREGGSVSIYNPDTPLDVVQHQSSYGREGFILQDLQELPTYNDYHLVIGSWVVDGQPAGIGLRADKSPITSNRAIFVPHCIHN